MDPLLGLLILFALLGRRGSGAASWSPTASPATGPSAFPPVPATAPAPVVPSPSIQAGKTWQPYHPLNQAVIARAEQLLHDPTMAPNDERIEPDPAGAGNVRYLKVKAPPGKISVTAWKPAPARGSRGGPAKAWHALSG